MFAFEHVTDELSGKLLLVVKDAHNLLLFNAHRIHWRDCRRRGQAYRIADNAPFTQKVT